SALAARRSAYHPVGSTTTAAAAPSHAHHPGGPGGPNASTAVAASSMPLATSSDPRRPSRWGAPRTPVARSSARSGSTLAKWAPIPSRPPATSSQTGGVAGSDQTTNAGRAVNPTRYGSGESGVDLSGQSYANPPASPTVIAAVASGPNGSASTTVATAATPAATATVRRLSRPCATGLSRRPTRASRVASIASLAQPIAS